MSRLCSSLSTKNGNERFLQALIYVQMRMVVDLDSTPQLNLISFPLECYHLVRCKLLGVGWQCVWFPFMFPCVFVACRPNSYMGSFVLNLFGS